MPPSVPQQSSETERESPASMGLRWPQFSSAKLLENNCNTAGHCPWELWWGFNTPAVSKEALGSLELLLFETIHVLVLGYQWQPNCQSLFKGHCFLSAHTPSPDSADSCIFLSSSHLLCYNATGSLLLLGTMSSLADVSRKRWLTDSLGPYRQPWFWERSSHRNVSLAVSPNDLPWPNITGLGFPHPDFNPLVYCCSWHLLGSASCQGLFQELPKLSLSRLPECFQSRGMQKGSSRCPSCPGQ